jgi:hypothetical protein
MSSVAKTAVASNYLLGGSAALCIVLLQLLAVCPLPVALLVPSLFLPVQLCTSFPPPRMVHPGVPPAKLAPARFSTGLLPSGIKFHPFVSFVVFSWPRTRVL